MTPPVVKYAQLVIAPLAQVGDEAWDERGLGRARGTCYSTLS